MPATAPGQLQMKKTRVTFHATQPLHLKRNRLLHSASYDINSPSPEDVGKSSRWCCNPGVLRRGSFTLSVADDAAI